MFVHLGDCLQLTPDTLVASVTVTRQEKTSSIKTVFSEILKLPCNHILFHSGCISWAKEHAGVHWISAILSLSSSRPALILIYPQKSWELIRTK